MSKRFGIGLRCTLCRRPVAKPHQPLLTACGSCGGGRFERVGEDEIHWEGPNVIVWTQGLGWKRES